MEHHAGCVGVANNIVSGGHVYVLNCSGRKVKLKIREVTGSFFVDRPARGRYVARQWHPRCGLFVGWTTRVVLKAGSLSSLNECFETQRRARASIQDCKRQQGNTADRSGTAPRMAFQSTVRVLNNECAAPDFFICLFLFIRSRPLVSWRKHRKGACVDTLLPSSRAAIRFLEIMEPLPTASQQTQTLHIKQARMGSLFCAEMFRLEVHCVITRLLVITFLITT